jgi:hypothetical protein
VTSELSITITEEGEPILCAFWPLDMIEPLSLEWTKYRVEQDRSPVLGRP